MIRGAIFDLDGTLIDSMYIWDTVGEDYLRSLGREPKENLAETFKTFTLEQAAMYYIEHYGVNLSVGEIVAGINETLENYYINTIPLKKGVAGFLERLKSENVKMCIATATDRHLVEAALKRCGVREYFSEVFTCSTVGYSKETPHIYREAQRHLQTEKCETVVFEDVYHALKTAKDDGFVCAAVFDAHEQLQDRLREEAHIYIEDFTDFDVFWGIVNKK